MNQSHPNTQLVEQLEKELLELEINQSKSYGAMQLKDSLKNYPSYTDGRGIVFEYQITEDEFITDEINAMLSRDVFIRAKQGITDLKGFINDCKALINKDTRDLQSDISWYDGEIEGVSNELDNVRCDLQTIQNTIDEIKELVDKRITAFHKSKLSGSAIVFKNSDEDDSIESLGLEIIQLEKTLSVNKESDAMSKFYGVREVLERIYSLRGDINLYQGSMDGYEIDLKSDEFSDGTKLVLKKAIKDYQRYISQTKTEINTLTQGLNLVDGLTSNGLAS